MNERILKFIFVPLSIVLFILLTNQLMQLPKGMILPGMMIGTTILIITVVGTFFVAFIAKKIYKKTSLITVLSIVGTFSFGLIFYWVYSPTLKIIVPEGYTGQVSLVLSNVDENDLTIDSNGIGYINQKTFERTFMKPIVVDEDGKSLNKHCVGYDTGTFWTNSEEWSSRYTNKVAYLSFRITSKPSPKKIQQQHPEVIDAVDWKKVMQSK